MMTRSPDSTKPRPTECVHGHPYVGDNIATRVSGVWRCRTCSRDRKKFQREQQKVLLKNAQGVLTELCALKLTVVNLNKEIAFLKKNQKPSTISTPQKPRSSF